MCISGHRKSSYKRHRIIPSAKNFFMYDVGSISTVSRVRSLILPEERLKSNFSLNQEWPQSQFRNTVKLILVAIMFASEFVEQWPIPKTLDYHFFFNILTIVRSFSKRTDNCADITVFIPRFCATMTRNTCLQNYSFCHFQLCLIFRTWSWEPNYHKIKFRARVYSFYFLLSLFCTCYFIGLLCHTSMKRNLLCRKR